MNKIETNLFNCKKKFQDYSFNTTGFHTALYSRYEQDKEGFKQNVEWAVNQWLDNGIDSSKLILGVSFFGKTFELEDDTRFGVGSNSLGPSVNLISQYSNETGVIPFFEVKTFFSLIINKTIHKKAILFLLDL